jgi:hypothetical protein
MVDISAIAGTVSALKGASDIAKAMIGLRDAQAIQTKVIELNNQILAAQSSAFTANDERTALIERVGNLEKEVARLKAWEAEKERYQLQEFPPGVFVRTLKQAMAKSEPIHRICTQCYENGEKSILQSLGTINGQETLKCHGCDSTFKVGTFQPPPPASARPSWGPSRRG